MLPGWFFRILLDEEYIWACQDEADLIAWAEANMPKAYEQLLPLLVKMRVHEFETKGR